MAIMPPAPGQPMPGPAMMQPPADQAPATQMLPALAMLAQQQQQALAMQQQQEMMLKEAMKQQILRLVSMMPIQNPAGIAARVEPMPANVSAADTEMSDDSDAGEEEAYENEEMM